MRKYKITIPVIVLFIVFLCLPSIALAATSGVKGEVFPGTCAVTMEDVPKGDAPWDKSAGGKSYVTAQWYKDAIKDWKTANLQQISIAGVSKDQLGEDIFVNKKAHSAFNKFSTALSNCPEIKDKTYKIEIFDHFTCRLMTGSKTELSFHSLGYAIDINVNENDYTNRPCKPTSCDYPPCFLKAAKDSGLNWGGASEPFLYPKCDMHHIEYVPGKGTNVKDADLIYCQKDLNPDACTSDKDCPPKKPICSVAEFKCTAGKSCTTSLDCEATEFCDASISQCLPQLQAGKPCDLGDQCISGGCTNKQCACKADGECENNKFCDTTTKNCTAKVAVGETCPTDKKHCISGACEEKTISKITQQTCVCLYQTHCPADKYCAAGGDLNAGLCINKLGAGAACVKDNHVVCQSGKCDATIPDANGNGKCTEPPATPATATSSTPAAPPEPVKYTTVAPKINVPIPGLEEFKTEEITAGDTVSIPWIAQYVVAVYKYMIIIGAVISVIMLMVGGLQYMISGAYAAAATKAKQLMLGAVGGLVVLLSANLILQMINPKLTSLSSIDLSSVPAVNYGDLANDIYGSFDPNAGAQIGPILPGQYRSVMLGPETCGNKDGMSLPTVAERQNKLKSIVNVWKQVAAEQGGAIYVRGGHAGCTDDSFSQEDYQLLSLANLFKSYPTFFAAHTANPCIKVVDEISKLTKEEIKGEATVISLRAKHGISNGACLPMINNIVTTSVVKPAQAAGMLCGDCGTFQEHLYSKCFDKNIGGRAKAGRACVMGSGLKKFRFKIEGATATVADVQKALSDLQFGDIIAMVKPGHFFMYTGKAGLGYEILEMGSGGSTGDISNNSYGAKKAVKNIGMDKLDASGVRAYNSAEKYLMGLLRKKITFCGYSVVDDSFFGK